jgi:hypothetical protein
LDQAVKDDALLLICTDLSCDLFFFDWLILGSTAVTDYKNCPCHIFTQLRNSYSFLNYDLSKVNIVNDAACSCGAPREDTFK